MKECVVVFIGCTILLSQSHLSPLHIERLLYVLLKNQFPTSLSPTSVVEERGDVPTGHPSPLLHHSC